MRQAYEVHRMGLDEARKLQNETNGLYCILNRRHRAGRLRDASKQSALETSPIDVHLISIGK